MLTHGWQSSGRIDWILKSKTEFLQLKDCNFIAIDWGTIAADVNYPEVVLNTPTIGRYVATFVDYLYTEGDLNFTSLYVTGHSIGAHVMGIMGSNVQNGRVGRITGLDPAGPGFQTASDDFRIERSDAVFVDIIHTNVCSLKDICLGLPGSYGHVDFFPNGGDSQPGCASQGPLADAISGCSHSRAHQYWLESINGVTNFKSVPCPDWDSYRAGLCVSCGQGCLNMGVHVNDQLTGSYFLETYAVSPYAKG
ncbi:pancreatic lipase-related protein 3-like [Palaemon carinicauda]|uniref:pancreatic lipase-related protein 3-like n=1 Tax=Palaemon carinicauda TaxID=392227 RepID=UPI0035B69402